MKLKFGTIGLIVAVFLINSIVANAAKNNFGFKREKGFGTNTEISRDRSKKKKKEDRKDGSTDKDADNPQGALKAKKMFAKGEYSDCADEFVNNRLRFTSPEYSAIYILSLLYSSQEENSQKFLDGRLDYFSFNHDSLTKFLNFLFNYNDYVVLKGKKSNFKSFSRDSFDACLNGLDIPENDSGKIANYSYINVRLNYEYQQYNDLVVHIEEVFTHARRARLNRTQMSKLTAIASEVFQGMKAFDSDFSSYKKASNVGKIEEMQKYLSNAKIKNKNNVNIYYFELPLLHITNKEDKYNQSLQELLAIRVSYKKLPANIRPYFMAKVIIERLYSDGEEKANSLLKKALKQNLYRTDSLVKALMVYEKTKNGNLFTKLDKKLLTKYLVNDFKKSRNLIHKTLVADSLAAVYTSFADESNAEKILRQKRKYLGYTVFSEDAQSDLKLDSEEDSKGDKKPKDGYDPEDEFDE
ncbi:hypothetical protein AAEX28_06555 [Lentisphaerota bacterium WC36G]|nr:hypothetical protein LJT99_09420 [Lentisphaerae bacterium WC36]